MERTMSVEEKIRRAEEIYERRRQGDTRPTTTLSVKNEKKDIKLLRKMIIQIIICILVYFAIYTIQNNDYIFSKDFINKVNEVLSYDINFPQLYENLKNQIMGFTNKPGIGGSSEDTNNLVNQNGVQENTNSTQEQVQASNEEMVEEQKKEEPPVPLTQEEQDILDIKNTVTFIKPVQGTISSKFGVRETATGNVPKNHTGTDLAANMGTKIVAAADGEVVLSSEEGDYGKHLKIQIGNVSIIYAHCNNLYVKQGDIIKQGQEIAEVGNTGNSTGPHLHFEIRIHERIIDPEKILSL